MSMPTPESPDSNTAERTTAREETAPATVEPTVSGSEMPARSLPDRNEVAARLVVRVAEEALVDRCRYGPYGHLMARYASEGQIVYLSRRSGETGGWESVTAFDGRLLIGTDPGADLETLTHALERAVLE